ncbi:hypothetical protein O9649_10145 [Achromobacter dolens]|uniref:hypothetical protein n=1 Tax=Achromobacter dolens TaxID=1287738 RepID=UPI0022B870A1|nr:hypothetical protein [Achromobacter dolens]MCZ8408148.1 hypothetical protein [Achromobacter dolens]
MAKDCWSKAKDVTHMLAALAIPVVLGWIGWEIQSAIKDRELKRDYVQIATGILAAKDSDRALRTWAVAVLGAHSPVALSAELKDDLENGAYGLKLPQLSSIGMLSVINAAEYEKSAAEIMNALRDLESREAVQGKMDRK